MGKWCRVTTYGGKLAENLTQATSRQLHEWLSDRMREVMTAPDKPWFHRTTLPEIHRELFFSDQPQPMKETNTMNLIKALDALKGPILDSIHAYGGTSQAYGEAKAKRRLVPETNVTNPAIKCDEALNAALVLIAGAIKEAEGPVDLGQVKGKFHVRGHYCGSRTASWLGRWAATGPVNGWASADVSAHMIQHSLAEALKVAAEAKLTVNYGGGPVWIEPVPETPKLADRATPTPDAVALVDAVEETLCEYQVADEGDLAPRRAYHAARAAVLARMDRRAVFEACVAALKDKQKMFIDVGCDGPVVNAFSSAMGVIRSLADKETGNG